MKADPGQLLRTLGSGVLPVNAAQAPRAVGSGSDRFAALLGAAGASSLSPQASGLPVAIDPDLELELTTEQSERLSAAADLAESRGLSTVGVLMDGMALVLDVANRLVVGEAGSTPGGVTPVEGLIRADAPQQSGQGSRGPIAGADLAPGVLEVLSEAERSRAARDDDRSQNEREG